MIVCRNCGGSGTVMVPRAAVRDGKIGTAIVEEQCKPCDGTGWITPKDDD